jgi:hypothetical protein
MLKWCSVKDLYVVCPVLVKTGICFVDVKDTGRFIMYSRITKIYYRKTVGHVFTKPVHIEGTTQKYFLQ